MNKCDDEVTFQELESYIRGEVDPEARARIERYLTRDPDLASEVQRDGIVRTHLRNLFAPILHEPIPSHLLSILNADKSH